MKKKTTTDKLGRKHGGGMPAAKIDLGELEKLCVAQSTHEEIAAYFGVAVKTIGRHSKLGNVVEVMERGKAKGRALLRSKQMALALAGDRTMLIWLGKQLLGQRDHIEHEHGGTGGGPIEYLSVVLPRITQAD